MKYLLYCVFRNSSPWRPKTLPGVEAQPVFLVGKNGLSAAVSRISGSDPAPAVSRILAYHKVIESIHRRRAVIPLRYGSLLEQESQIVEYLEERRQQYEALLQELEGRVEMGIRVLFDKAECRMPVAEGSGAAYLAAQRDRYARDDRLAVEQEMVVEKTYSLLSGLFVRSKAESSLLAGSRLLSLHFLVPQKSVRLFRKAFRRLDPGQSVKLLLSGPWPAHNFVE